MKFGGDRLGRLQSARDEAEKRKKDFLDRARLPKEAKVVAAPATEHSTQVESAAASLDVPVALKSIEQLRLYRYEQALSEPFQLNRPTLTLIQLFLECVQSKRSNVVLQWPFGQKDISSLQSLSALALLGGTKQKVLNGYSCCEPAHPMRSLYFPWRGMGTGADQRNYLIDRNKIIEWNGFHLSRGCAQPSEESQFHFHLHQTYSHLNMLQARDDSKPHLAHPALSELCPVFGSDTKPYFKEPVSPLLGRIEFSAKLNKQSDYRDEICNPDRTPFGTFGAAPGSDLRSIVASGCLEATAKTLGVNVSLVDLGPPAIRFLGPDWERHLIKFIDETLRKYPQLPIFVVTNDPYIHKRAHQILKGRLDSSRAPKTNIVTRTSSDLVTHDPAIENVTNPSFTFRALAGTASLAIEAMSDAAKGMKDLSVAANIRLKMGSLRRATALPCGLNEAYRVLHEKLGQGAAEAFLEYRSRSSLLEPVEAALEGEISGPERARLENAKGIVSKLFDELEVDTPTGSYLNELAAILGRKSTGTIIVLATENDVILASHVLCKSGEAGLACQNRIKGGQLKLLSANSLLAELASIEFSAESRAFWKRLILVSPRNDWFSTVATHPWLPEELTVICDVPFALRVSRVFEALSTHKDVSGPNRLGVRLTRIAKEAAREAHARDVSSVTWSLTPIERADTREQHIDLSDAEGDPAQMMFMTLASGRTLTASPGTVVIKFNRDADTSPFEKWSARELRPGSSLLVPDSAFVEEARKILSLKVLAKDQVAAYHGFIAAMLPSIAGDTRAEKVRSIKRKMQKAIGEAPSDASISDWINVSEHQKLPLDQIRPHAPQKHRDFRAFMGALGMPEIAADEFWSTGIQPTRLERRGAGKRMARAYVSVMVDQHGSASGMSNEIRIGIKKLHAKALDFIDQIKDIRSAERRDVEGL